MKDTKIQWATHTFNPWTGCTKVSPGCLNCYAEARSHRFGQDNWGKGKSRIRTSKANWFGPRRWNNEDPHTEQYRARIFCASLADWLDDEVPVEWLADLLKLIHETPNCDWLLLTKRPENWLERVSLAQDWHFDNGDRNVCGWIQDWWKHGIAPKNIWIGTSVEDQVRADERIQQILLIPAKIRFLSAEPLLGAIDFKFRNMIREPANPDNFELGTKPAIDWIIAGGESGPGARSCHVDWIRSVLHQCRAAGVTPFVKQLGSDVVGNEMDKWVTRIKDKKGGDMAEWPAELRVREFPVV